jgi:hypothetical protein
LSHFDCLAIPLPAYILDLSLPAVQLANSRDSRPPTVSRFTFVLLALILGLLAQLFIQRRAIHSQETVIEDLKASGSKAQTAPISTQTVYQEAICPNPILKSLGTLFNPIERSMPLHESARRVAQEFEFSTDALNKGVQQFLSEMRKRSYTCREESKANIQGR